ncbi:hypothetical protein K470DRAFT_70453 [Piedraia hortae CBS 480.64]|uniref:Lytic polysaccharide monooxygenase n=1 Tax=Piedraia hortae CBS 480.64 TaxID=1314780 RepID=A0A6A7BYN8_9PEZI|nr:hypothetical protein K470DRAFT_70453 [Piedraia hortae CBS 480.64]
MKKILPRIVFIVISPIVVATCQQKHSIALYSLKIVEKGHRDNQHNSGFHQEPQRGLAPMVALVGPVTPFADARDHGVPIGQVPFDYHIGNPHAHYPPSDGKLIFSSCTRIDNNFHMSLLRPATMRSPGQQSTCPRQVHILLSGWNSKHQLSSPIIFFAEKVTTYLHGSTKCKSPTLAIDHGPRPYR